MPSTPDRVSSQTAGVGGRLAVVRTAAARRPPAGLPDTAAVAEADPVAKVVVDVPLPHLDHPFEYAVPRALADLARPGVRVKVRFAGQDVDGYVVDRVASADGGRPLTPLRRVVSPEPVLTPAVLALARAVADRYAGSLADVLRLAVPPRHATAERSLAPAVVPDGPNLAAPAVVPGGPNLAAPAVVPDGQVSATGYADWSSAYPAFGAFLRRVQRGETPAASLQVLPAQPAVADWPALLAAAAGAALAAGRGALLVVPDQRDVDRVEAAVRDTLGPGSCVRLTSGQRPQARYTAWLKVLRGHVRCVVGTRAAAFAPVRDLGLVALWDDGDDLLAEPRAPYPHARQVLALRAASESSALLLAGFARTTAVQRLVEDGLVRPVAPTPAALRRCAPRRLVAGEEDVARDGPAAHAHLPSLAWRVAHAALQRGPVLVQVPRRGYLPTLSCQTCRTPARCRHCHGPLRQTGPQQAPACAWCGRGEAAFTCRDCEGTTLRAGVIGARRTAEELGRAFPGVPVRTSAGGQVLATVEGRPALVIATPGAEPVAAGGYAAALLLDAWALLDRPGLDAGQEALRRWLGAAALSRGASDGGVVVLCGAPGHVTLPVVEALVRWDPAWFAQRDLADRTVLGLPPAAVVARLLGTRSALREAMAGVLLPASAEQVGPIGYSGDPPAREGGPRQQLLVRVAPSHAAALAEGMAAVRAKQSAQKVRDPVHVQIDPPDLA
ncbi:MAG TPA: primosome assembly protein PriA [Dermatophilaceae bacterium]|nr:primosome assembly protein PriA [Dermatophilaceae bacterium]